MFGNSSAIGWPWGRSACSLTRAGADTISSSTRTRRFGSRSSSQACGSPRRFTVCGSRWKPRPPALIPSCAAIWRHREGVAEVGAEFDLVARGRRRRLWHSERLRQGRALGGNTFRSICKDDCSGGVYGKCRAPQGRHPPLGPKEALPGALRSASSLRSQPSAESSTHPCPRKDGRPDCNSCHAPYPDIQKLFSAPKLRSLVHDTAATVVAARFGTKPSFPMGCLNDGVRLQQTFPGCTNAMVDRPRLVDRRPAILGPHGREADNRSRNFELTSTKALRRSPATHRSISFPSLLMCQEQAARRSRPGKTTRQAWRIQRLETNLTLPSNHKPWPW